MVGFVDLALALRAREEWFINNLLKKVLTLDIYNYKHAAIDKDCVYMTRRRTKVFPNVLHFHQKRYKKFTAASGDP